MRLNRQIGCSVESRLAAQHCLFDAGVGVAKCETTPLNLLNESRVEEVPCCKNTAAHEIQRVVKNIDQHGQSNTEGLAHAGEDSQGAFIALHCEVVDILRT